MPPEVHANSQYLVAKLCSYNKNSVALPSLLMNAKTLRMLLNGNLFSEAIKTIAVVIERLAKKDDVRLDVASTRTTDAD